MKFILQWKIQPDKVSQVVETFAKMSLDDLKTHHGEKIKLIGRWHDIAGVRGVAVFETDDLEAIHLWALRWNSVVDLDLFPVVDDDEGHATANKFLSQS